uniref:Uncharacterized protein n=1 Tax=Candidatus Kentrum sp. TUN TaxID=2126343 RepID=A0A451A063_9GAMM|nr:MAG: hypothetical protein BECKTUN1418D_GA0071000_11022 [Candidatus Kentron sp. TUN]
MNQKIVTSRSKGEIEGVWNSYQDTKFLAQRRMTHFCHPFAARSFASAWINAL